MNSIIVGVLTELCNSRGDDNYVILGVMTEICNSRRTN